MMTLRSGSSFSVCKQPKRDTLMKDIVFFSLRQGITFENEANNEKNNKKQNLFAK